MPLSTVRLPDGSEIYLRPETQMDIAVVADPANTASGDVVFVRQGQILVVSHLPADTWFTVYSANGHVGRVKGSIILVDYDAPQDQFTVVCIEGICELGQNTQELLPLAAWDRAWFDANGNFQGPFEANLDDLRRVYGDLIPDKTAVTPFPTPNLEATATASCQEFQAEFPGTPCP